MSCWISSSRLQITFTGPSTCLAILTASTVPSASSLPAETTANQMIVNFDRIPWPTGEFGHQRLRERHGLRPDPNVATILLQINGAVHRLHRRMGQERYLIDGFEPLRRLSKSLRCIAIGTGNRARLFGFFL